MRLSGTRWLQLGLISLTILAALAVGYVTAGLAMRGGLAPSTEIVGPAATDTSLALDDTTTPAAQSPVAVVETEALPTATVAPTQTLAVTATVPAAQQPDVFIEDSFSSPANGWPTRETATWSAGYVDQRYQLTLNGQTSIGFTTPLPADNYRLSVDIGIENGGAGLVFLFADPATTYRIILTTDGAYALERQTNNDVIRLVDWTANPALKQGINAINRLTVERQGDVVRFFANDQPLTEYKIEPGNFSNRYGFVLTSKSGQGKAFFDNLRGERLPNP